MRFGFLFVLSVLVLSLTACGSHPSAESRQELAQCVTDAGWAMYGAYRCSHCMAQKQLFGDAFDVITYIECAEDAVDGQPEVCAIAGVTGYPTWIGPDGSRLYGQQTLDSLANAAGCFITE